MKSNNLKITELEIPFPVIAIDDFMPTSLLRAASNSFPNLDWEGWYTYDGNTSSSTALKVVTKDFISINRPSLVALDYIATHFDPTEYFKEFGFNIDVFPDVEYYAAGMHMLPENGFLGMHLDADIHPTGNQIWRREYSAILCASEEYDSTFDLLLHNEKEYGRVPYKFNRLMVFKCSGNMWHGIPDPITSGMVRKTLNIFYWSLLNENTNIENKRMHAFYRDEEV